MAGCVGSLAASKVQILQQQAVFRGGRPRPAGWPLQQAFQRHFLPPSLWAKCSGAGSGTQALRGRGGPRKACGLCREANERYTLPLLHRTPHLPGTTREGLGRPEVPTVSLGSCLVGHGAPKRTAPQQLLRKMRLSRSVTSWRPGVSCGDSWGPQRPAEKAQVRPARAVMGATVSVNCVSVPRVLVAA